MRPTSRAAARVSASRSAAPIGSPSAARTPFSPELDRGRRRRARHSSPRSSRRRRRCARTTRQPSSSARACKTRPASSSRSSVVTRTAPGFRMPTFSRAIAARVLPRISVCSSPMLVTTAISPSTMLVEIEPPAEADLDDRPFDARLAKDDESRRGQEIEPGRLGRRGPRSARGLVGVERARQRARRASRSSTSRPCRLTRSVTCSTCGEP